MTSLGKRDLPGRAETRARGGGPRRRRYWIYGSDPGFHDEPGTDLAAVAAGRIAVTPIHFDLTDRPASRRCGASTWRRCSPRSHLTQHREHAAEANSRAEQARVDELKSELEDHAHRYYVLDDPEIGDDEYDALLDELRGIEREHPRAR